MSEARFACGAGAWNESHSLRITPHHLAVDPAGPDFEVDHGLRHQRIALRPVVAPRVIAGCRPGHDAP